MIPSARRAERLDVPPVQALSEARKLALAIAVHAALLLVRARRGGCARAPIARMRRRSFLVALAHSGQLVDVPFVIGCTKALAECNRPYANGPEDRCINEC
jgi:hypothetical protein